MSNKGHKINSIGELPFGVRQWMFLNVAFPVSGSKKKEVQWTKRIAGNEGMSF